jgi:hypothetical protein
MTERKRKENLTMHLDWLYSNANEGSKLGYMMAGELEPEIKRIGVDLVQSQLKTLGSNIVLNFNEF